ncbi:UDP-N-acetylmuramate--L-alanine ligase [Yinghuangia seranimata]|uniref:UDP-N-acetylmuramate--L-alanine ligase n=1 Tax=Yinghuangia seranimata TaxID=408067 RepID=UPI00248B203B|nr:UDP-N-acetylmuramate--L-alanine ligase [Yinghuangia seranimata]MDI2125129.1 UDP-N-acetylmuramate--L-alanine ligase [Yinghuangia seranimata]
MAAPDAPVSDPAIDLGSPHFIGIGGAGMSGLAKILAIRGAKVAGSDAKESTALLALRALGCQVHVGHAAANLGDASCVVVSSAIRADNPELVAAQERGIPVVHRADALARLMDNRRAVAVAGTHGKTTTTSMLAVSLTSLGLDPSFAIGADLNEAGSNAHHGEGEIFVAEADESDRSFHKYAPEVAVVLNVELDHHANYASLDEVLDSFETFAHRIVPGGTLVLSADDSGALALRDRLAVSAPQLTVVTVGERDEADLQLVKIEPQGLASKVTVRVGKAGGEHVFTVSVPGRVNASNAVMALAVGRALGLETDAMGTALGNYQGVRRRFQLKGEAGGVRVVDSYAHHPTEIAADLETARGAVGAGRVIAVFQPHLFSRTQQLGTDMGRALAAADIALIMDIYAAREDPQPGITSHIVAHSALDHGGLVRMEHSWSEVADVVARIARPMDLVLTMGAGDVTLLGPEILEAINQR